MSAVVFLSFYGSSSDFMILSVPIVFRITLQGFPQATTSEGMSLVTTLPAPMDGVAADGDAGQQDSSAADPYVVSDDYRGGLRFAECKGTVFPGRSEALCGAGGMKGGIDLYVGGNERVVADDDPVVVQKRTVHVHFTVISKINIVSIVGIERSGDPEVFASASQKLREDPVFCLCVRGIRLIVVPDQVFCLMPLSQKLGIAAVVKLPGKHFFSFGHKNLLLDIYVTLYSNRQDVSI